MNSTARSTSRRSDPTSGTRIRRRTLAGVAVLMSLLAPAAASANGIPGPNHRFAVVREGDPSLPDHTIIRPANLRAVQFKMPIVVWGNGGCRDSNEEYHYFLTHFAAYGFFIVADGPPRTPITRVSLRAC